MTPGETAAILAPGTTPTMQIELPEDIPVTDIDAAVFSFAQQGTEIITKKLGEMMIDAEANYLIIELSQQETLRFTDNMLIEMQLKFKRQNNVEKTDVVRMAVDTVINKEVI